MTATLLQFPTSRVVRTPAQTQDLGHTLAVALADVPAPTQAPDPSADLALDLAVALSNDPTARPKQAAATRFEVGSTYATNSVCDSGCWFVFQVVKRTAKTVWLLDVHGDTKARRVRTRDGVEACDPHGRYSMSPVLEASDLRS